MSVISLDMIRAFATANQIDLTDGTQYLGVIGSLEAWESGVGMLDENLVTGVNEALFAPLVAAYTAASAASASGTESTVAAGTQDAGSEQASA